MAPKDESEYSKEGLLQQARLWDEQARSIAASSQSIGGMNIAADGGRAFGACVDAYNVSQRELANWTEQGRQAMEKITSALAEAARKYGASEAEINDAIKSIGGRGRPGN
jgi:hypothetical protein